jgi:hypothetical protein
MNYKASSYCLFIRLIYLDAASADTRTTRALPSRAPGQCWQSMPASTQRLTSCLFSSAYGATTIVILAPGSKAGIMKTWLFPPPVGRTTTSGLSLATASRIASSCCGVRNWAWSSRTTDHRASNMIWSWLGAESGSLSCSTLGHLTGVSSSCTSADAFLFKEDGGDDACSSPRNLCQR